MSDTRSLRDIEWQGFAVMGRRPRSPAPANAILSAVATGWQMALEGRNARDWDGLAHDLMTHPDDGASTYMLTNGHPEQCIFRAATFLGDCLTGAVLVSPSPLRIDRDWLVARLGTELGPGERFRLLDGRPSGAMTPRRRAICYCHQVGDNEIHEAIARGCRTVEAVGLATRAGTNCGSCQARIADLLERQHLG